MCQGPTDVHLTKKKDRMRSQEQQGAKQSQQGHIRRVSHPNTAHNHSHTHVRAGHKRPNRIRSDLVNNNSVTIQDCAQKVDNANRHSAQSTSGAQSPTSYLQNRSPNSPGPQKSSSPIPSKIQAMGGRSPCASPPAYAGAKCYEPPSPTVLPKPPTHWMMNSDENQVPRNKSCDEMTSVLKVMLKVQA